jgi:protein TonB
MKHRGFVVVSLLSILPFFAGPAAAQSLKPVGRERPNIVQNWQVRLKAADSSLRSGEWKKAKSLTGSLLKEMRERIESGPGAANILALASLFKALAEAGLGEADAATWDWYTARSLYPPIGETDLSAYGEAGAFLLGVRTPEVKSPDELPAGSAERVTAPVKVGGEPPFYPVALHAACLEGQVAVRVILDEQGRPLFPEVVDSAGGPVMSFTTLEAMRTWKFRPATLDGKPIAVTYVLTANFDVPTCTNPAAVAGRAGTKP